MDKIVGKIICASILFTCLAVANISVRTINLKGAAIQEVSAGEPFKLEVSLEKSSSSMQSPQVKGIEQFYLNGRESHMQIINGQTSIRYLFTLTNNKPGTYTLGPVVLTDTGKQLSSETVSIKVVAANTSQAASVQAGTARESSKQLFARLLVDKKRVVVGEKVTCSLELYYTVEDIHIKDITQPASADFSTSPRRGPIKHPDKMIDSINYHCVELQWDVVPNKKGMIVVPALCVDYMEPAQEENLFVQFWPGQRFKNRRAYSNAISFNVDDLPAHDEPVQGLGKFNRFSAHLKPAVAKLGEGMVLTLSLEGEGSAALDTPTLTGMPPQLKWYESKSYTTEETHNENAKNCFEYIVQGLENGQWHIPAQKFVFYDTSVRRYRTLTTQPIKVTIHAQKNEQVAHSTKAKEEMHENNEIDVIDDEIRPIHLEELEQQEPHYLPWHFFLLLGSLPLLVVVYIYGRQNFSYAPATMNKKQAYAFARLSLKQAEKTNNQARIYPIFMELFAARLAMPVAQLSQEAIEVPLETRGLTRDELQELQKFLSISATRAFAGAYDLRTAPDIFQQAYDWLSILEGRI